MKIDKRSVMVVFGTRPEAIKLAPIVLGLANHPWLDCRVCVTAQHREMLDQVLSTFGIKPHIDLDLMRPDQNLVHLTARAIAELDGVFSREHPALILVQGDTTTVFCATLAAFYQHIPVGHVEAGLRSGNLCAPWPEEANRVLTSRLASIHFAPTERARQNLIAEGVPSASIHVTGNTVVDALLYTLEKSKRESLPDFQEFGEIADIPASSKIVLITGHRRESFGKGFEEICLAIGDLADKFPQTHFVYPVHLNPNVCEPVGRLLRSNARPNVHLIKPLSYTTFVSLMERSFFILTDSGGIQEEAPTLGKPVLVMRETTERPEAIEAGTAKLVGANRESIVAEATRLLTDPFAYQKMARGHNPYGDGKAASRIIQACENFLSVSSEDKSEGGIR